MCATQGFLQRPCWTTILCINYISHRFRPKLFVEVLSMKLAPCHLLDGTIFTLCHSILLSHIRGSCLLYDIMILQKMVECLENKLPAIVWPNHFDFILQLCLWMPWTPWTSKSNLISNLTHNNTSIQKSSIIIIKYLAMPMDVLFMGHTH